ncbi:MAG: phosphoribosyl-ATP diphosphatase [Azospirillaceae bacterium]
MASKQTVDTLFQVIAARKGADPESSYTARLFARGPEQIAKKLGEEGVEAAIEIVRGDRDKLVCESADLLYHLLVAWAALDIEPERVWAELERRAGTSGLEEKAKRKEQG